MLDSKHAFSSFAVNDIEAAKRFYGETLGVEISQFEGQDELLALHVGGNGPTMVYPKEDFTPASYTVMHFEVDDIAKEVDDLEARGVHMERYEQFDQDERGIARDAPGPPAAWFKDPAGNIIGLVEMQR